VEHGCRRGNRAAGLGQDACGKTNRRRIARRISSSVTVTMASTIFANMFKVDGANALRAQAVRRRAGPHFHLKWIVSCLPSSWPARQR